jgi:hypothetical protein
LELLKGNVKEMWRFLFLKTIQKKENIVLVSFMHASRRCMLEPWCDAMNYGLFCDFLLIYHQNIHDFPAGI